MIALPLGGGTLVDAMDRVEQVDDMFVPHLADTRYVGGRDEYRQTFSAITKITVFEDHFTIDFKSGLTIDIKE